MKNQIEPKTIGYKINLLAPAKGELLAQLCRYMIEKGLKIEL